MASNMKLQILFLITFVTFISAGLLLVPQISRTYDPAEKDPLHVKWFLWEDETGLIHNESLIEASTIPRSDYGIADVKIMLYTPENRNEYQLIEPTKNSTLIDSIQFNPKLRNFVIIHGWNNDYSSPVNELIKNALLDTQEVNVFIVDWGKVANKNYISARLAVNGIGYGIGNFLQSFIDNNELTSKDIALIGHSLGAHVAGKAGATMSTKPHSIVGLDPALPLFCLDNIDDRLDPSDADYVQIIHTTAGKLTFKSSLGDVDFFPNGGGPSQPGCGIDLFGSCAHGRSYRYFAESLNLCNFNAVQCSSYKEFEDGKCNNNERSYLGCFNLDQRNFGDFYLNTNDKAPFENGTNLI